MQSLAVRDLKVGDVTSALVVAHCQFFLLLQAAVGCCYSMLLQHAATE